MSLGTWFRDSVYIPLGGNRVSKGRYLLNIFVVWALTGLWHGGSWNFVIWGLYFAVLLMIEKMWLLERLKNSKFLGHVYALLFVMIGFVIFNASNMNEAWIYIKSMFGLGTVPFCTAEAIYYLKSYAILFVAAIIGATPIPNLTTKQIKGIRFIEPVILLLIVCVATAFLVDGSFNPFLYFRF